MTEENLPRPMGVVTVDEHGNRVIHDSREEDSTELVDLKCFDCGKQESVPMPPEIAKDLREQEEFQNTGTLPGLRCPECANRNMLSELFGGLLDSPEPGVIVLGDPFIESDGEPPF